MLRLGAKSLSTAELLALFFRVGGVGYSAVDLGNALIERFPTLNHMARASIDELTSVRGIGKAKACELAAAFELGQRFAAERSTNKPLNSPMLVEALLGHEMRSLNHEHLRVLLTDTRHQLIRAEEISRGSVNESIAHPRDVLRPAILAAAYGMILVHNHPSGDPSPSSADIQLTKRIQEAAELMKIKLIDHVIIGTRSNHRPGYFSFRENGQL
ncbi:DNA repair protein RadC [Sulfuriroseicoccus oceanibius]|uniref:DNA repair protein RadC n=2 Tax=Sulfuriroseicoccus oceanibius TaxID=2707525 RepID=A0A6B3LAY8_9BACT|nr:DNA repair protein RadC [Sulfuriroseicoccus oceanibius]